MDNEPTEPPLPSENVPTDRIDQLLRLTQPKAWVSLIFVLLLLAIFVVWSFVGRITTEVAGRGIILNARGVFGVESPAQGAITQLLVKQGEMVQKGDLLAKIYNPQRQAIERNISGLEYKIEQLQLQLKLLQDRLEEREKLFKEGLIPKATVEETRQNMISQHIAEEDAKSNMANLLAELEKISPDVVAPEDGRVLEIFVNVGDRVEVKSPLVWMEHPAEQGEKRFIYCCIPIQSGRVMSSGMPVQVEPITVNPQEYGSMFARVKEVSPFAVSEAELLNDLRNKQLVAYLIQGAPAVAFLSVDPILDPSTSSGFKWTSGKGPPFDIPSGTLVNIKVVVDEQPPISYLIPLWRLHPSNYVTQP